MTRARSAWRSLCKVGGPVGGAVIILLGLILSFALILGAVDVVERVKSAVDSTPATSRCDETRPRVSRAQGKVPTARVVLRPTLQEVTWAFDASRSAVGVPIVITATPPLTGVSATAIEILPSPLLRTDNHQRFPNDLTHTAPTISRNGEQISFEICLDPNGITAGRYAGSLFVSAGPPNAIGTTVHLVVTARSPGWFGLGLLAMLAAIAVALTLKGVSDYTRSIEGTKKNGADTPFVPLEALTYIWRWGELRLISSAAGVLTALFVGFRVYNADRIWGDDAYQDSVALVAAAIAAVGAQGIFDGFLGARRLRS